jgi:hypothetical protein
VLSSSISGVEQCAPWLFTGDAFVCVVYVCVMCMYVCVVYVCSVVRACN